MTGGCAATGSKRPLRSVKQTDACALHDYLDMRHLENRIPLTSSSAPSHWGVAQTQMILCLQGLLSFAVLSQIHKVNVLVGCNTHLSAQHIVEHFKSAHVLEHSDVHVDLWRLFVLNCWMPSEQIFHIVTRTCSWWRACNSASSRSTSSLRGCS